MKFSCSVPLQRIINGTYEYDLYSFLRECQALEHAGFDSITAGERRIGPTAYCPSPHVLAATALSHTARIRYLSSVVVLPLREPIGLAQDAAVTNAFFPGRYRLGVGAGYNQHAFHLLGVSLGDRGRLMEEGMTAIRDYFDDQLSVDLGQGVFPVRDPAMGNLTPEVWGAAWAPGGVERVARLADGWMPDPMRTLDVVAELAGRYREMCASVNKKPRIALIREAWVADTDEEARETFGPFLAHAHSQYFARQKGGWKSDDDASAGKPYDVKIDPWLAEVNSPDDLKADYLWDRVLVGSVETVRAGIEEIRDVLDPEELILRFRFQGGPSPVQTLEVIERFGAEIIPHYDPTAPGATPRSAE